MQSNFGDHARCSHAVYEWFAKPPGPQRCFLNHGVVLASRADFLGNRFFGDVVSLSLQKRHGHTQRHTHRHTHTHIHRYIHTYTHIHTHTYTHTHCTHARTPHACTHTHTSVLCKSAQPHTPHASERARTHTHMISAQKPRFRFFSLRSSEFHAGFG